MDSHEREVGTRSCFRSAAEGRARLHAGAVEEAFTLFAEAWRSFLGQRTHHRGSREGDRRELARDLAFVRTTVDLALIYERYDEAFDWLERWKRRFRAARLSAARRRLLEFRHAALCARARWFFGQMDDGRAFFGRITGSAGPALERWPHWVFNFYLAALLEDGDFARAKGLLRSRRRLQETDTPLDRALLLNLIGWRFRMDGRYDRALVVYDACVRTCARVSGPERHFVLGMTLSTRAVCHAEAGASAAAFADLERAGRLARRLKCRRLLRAVHTTRLFCLKRLGEYSQVQRRVAQWRSREPGPDSASGARSGDPYREAMGLLHAAWCSLKTYRPRKAQRFLDEATPFVESCSSFRLRAFHRIVSADVLLGIPEKSRLRLDVVARVRREYEAAEALLDRLASSEYRLALLLRLGRGWLALKTGARSEAVRLALECMALSRERGVVDLESQALLLQSALLLLDRSESGDRLYDGILPRLGIIPDPETLFRVVANLYLYNWEHTKDLELIDLHWRQIQGLRPRLRVARFDDLFRSLVYQPVLRSMWHKLLGG